jgi:mannose-1-phosphate guanylyltransferase
MIHPVIMAGGSGTRFWPRSRLRRPKQLIRVFGQGTLIEQTVSRLRRDFPPQSILIMTNAAQVEETRRLLPEVPAGRVIGEPAGRDTAACIALAAALLLKSDPEAVMVVLAADQVVGDADAFLNCVREAARLAEAQRLLVTLGIPPAYASDQYGYIRRGEALPGPENAPPAYRVAEFVEKPDRARAETLIASGGHYWNSGNFVWRAEDILSAVQEHLPELFAGLERIRPALGGADQAAVLAKEYPLLPKVSIDYGVMENVSNAAVVEAELDWDDVGSWNAIARHEAPDASGNFAPALHAGLDTRDCIIVGEEGRLVATLGVKDLIIVETPDATLVCDRRRAADVKALVELLRRRGLDRYL